MVCFWSREVAEAGVCSTILILSYAHLYYAMLYANLQFFVQKNINKITRSQPVVVSSQF